MRFPFKCYEGYIIWELGGRKRRFAITNLLMKHGCSNRNSQNGMKQWSLNYPRCGDQTMQMYDKWFCFRNLVEYLAIPCRSCLSFMSVKRAKTGQPFHKSINHWKVLGEFLVSSISGKFLSKIGSHSASFTDGNVRYFVSQVWERYLDETSKEVEIPLPAQGEAAWFNGGFLRHLELKKRLASHHSRLDFVKVCVLQGKLTWNLKIT